MGVQHFSQVPGRTGAEAERRLQVFVYSDPTTEPSPVSAECWQIHRLLTVLVPLLRVWVGIRGLRTLCCLAALTS
jgi:hypothetical protein